MIRVRASNTSVREWRFRPGTFHGVHARYQVRDALGRVAIEERAGLFDATVAPGQAIELDLGIPPLPAGRYALHVDLIDVDQSAFSQFGVEPAVYEFSARR